MLTGFVAMNACRKSPLGWDSDLLIPVLKSDLGVDDIFTDSLLVENPDQSWKLVLDQELNKVDINNLVEVHDTLSKDIFNIPIYFKVPPGQEIIKQQSNYTMELGDVELIKARADTARLKFYVTNTIERPLKIKYEVLSSEKNGSHFSIIDDVPPADASGPSHVVKSIDLADYNMDFTGPDHNRVNMVMSRTTVWIDPNADTVWVTPADSIVVTSVFESLDIGYASGYFGQSSDKIIDSSHISTFKNFKKGAFNLKKASAELQINNGLGLDVRMKINEIYSENSEHASRVLLSDPIIGKSLNVLRATETGDPANPVSPRKYVFPLTNSNITDLISNQPDEIGFKMWYEMNPLGNISGGRDFIYNKHTLEGKIHMEIPLNVDMDSLVIEDYSTVNFNSDKIKGGRLIISADNLFPYDAEIQFYMLDENRNIVDSLLPENIKSPHGVMSQGYVIKPVHSEMPLPLDEAVIEKLKKTKEILIWARINNAGSTTYQLYHHYKIAVKLIADVEYEY